MEVGGAIFHSDSEPSAAVGGQKAKREKVVKRDSVLVGASQKKTLADITNVVQQQPQPLNQPPKQQNAPLAAPDISVDMLLKENAMLMKVLANRNAIIESCKAELQKCQSNFQKLRKQNSELALTNSQMLAELNSSRQRRRELEQELGSKNGILKAMKLELAAKEHTVKLKHETDANEVGTHQSKQSDQSLQEDDRGDAKRKRVSKSKSCAPAVTGQLKSTAMVDNRRYSLRQSAGMKTEKPKPTEDFFEVDDVSNLQENLANENGPTSSRSEVHEQAIEDTESSGPANTEQVHAKKDIKNKRHSLRRQSNKFRPKNPEPTTEDWRYDISRPENPKPTEDWQSDNLRPPNTESTEDFFKIDDANFSISRLCNNLPEKNHPIMSRVTREQEGCTFEPLEPRRSSVGRPLRRTVEKVASYKEVPLNVKMRRPN